ncbi:MAG TPA: sensor histidine kinase [Candidatus Avipropionibacterium avicola]|uniref:Oxygen sensor histidine kinase NreB n=1 Tax=Candidatus Avipropionibacterium avicola TaxID=2840701 RepID=A0A9D1H054_9ACTN|nr:sensor histidine kinase [Candidatus Avipropionibacterium avicola]
MTSRRASRSPAEPGLVHAIRVGQAVITVVLVVIGAARAIGAGATVGWTVAVAVGFLGWYGIGLALARRSRDRRRGAIWLGLLAAVWIGAVVVSAEFVWLAFPLWLLAGFVMPLRWAVPFAVAVFAVVAGAPVLHHGTTSYANVIGPLVGGIFALGISRGYLELVRDGRERRRLINSLVSTQEEMAQLQDELARTQRESGAGVERTRLSRDIHDTIAQSLSSIGMLARSAGDREDVPEESRRALGQIQQMAAEGLADTRRIVNAMMPAELEGSALGEALRRMLTRLQDDTGLRTDLRVDPTVPALGVGGEVALLRTAQSALANVRTHARAERVVVSLVDGGDVVRLDIVDDGIGFDLAGWDGERPSDGSGYGLRAMRARLRDLGGNLDIETAPGDGTALSAWLPIGGEQ